MKKKGTIYFNIALCVLFIAIGCYFFTIKSDRVITEGFPLYPVIGLITVIVHIGLLIKWLYIFVTQQTRNSDKK